MKAALAATGALALIAVALVGSYYGGIFGNHVQAIDLRAGSAAMIYIQTYADTDTLDVFLEGGLKLLVEGAAT